MSDPVGNDGLTDAEREDMARQFAERRPSLEARRAFAAWRARKAVGEGEVYETGEAFLESLGIPKGVHDPSEPTDHYGLTKADRKFIADRYSEQYRPKPEDAARLAAWLSEKQGREGSPS